MRTCRSPEIGPGVSLQPLIAEPPGSAVGPLVAAGQAVDGPICPLAWLPGHGFPVALFLGQPRNAPPALECGL